MNFTLSSPNAARQSSTDTKLPERAADSADDAMEEEKDRRMDAADLPEANAATDLGLVDKIAASIMMSLVMFTTHESFKAPN